MASVDRGGDQARRGTPLIDDTIVALSSGAPPAAIAVIRMSGPAAFSTAGALAGPLPEPRRAALRAIRSGDLLLDRGLVLVFPGFDSATGEDLVEFHCHGGRAVVAAVEAALVDFVGVRRAEPGEFTRRALLNGRIDLTQAQGLADLLSAESESERRLAIAAADGLLSRRIREWLDRLTTLAAQVEASLDFADEGDVAAEAMTYALVSAQRDAIVAEMDTLLAAPPVERWREGRRVVLAGPPNAGKSTLMNLLAGRDVSIVADTAGTTRDRVEVTVRRLGVGYVLVDTAGLRAAPSDRVEKIGIARARVAIEEADLVLWLGDDPPNLSCDLLWVHARADQPGREVMPMTKDIAVAATLPDGIDRLWGVMAERLCTSERLPTFALHGDERSLLEIAVSELRDRSTDPVILAEALRAARRTLARVIGEDVTSALLDRIFSRFCLGK